MKNFLIFAFLCLSFSLNAQQQIRGTKLICTPPIDYITHSWGNYLYHPKKLIWIRFETTNIPESFQAVLDMVDKPKEEIQIVEAKDSITALIANGNNYVMLSLSTFFYVTISGNVKKEDIPNLLDFIDTIYYDKTATAFSQESIPFQMDFGINLEPFSISNDVYVFRTNDPLDKRIEVFVEYSGFTKGILETRSNEYILNFIVRKSRFINELGISFEKQDIYTFSDFDIVIASKLDTRSNSEIKIAIRIDKVETRNPILLFSFQISENSPYNNDSIVAALKTLTYSKKLVK